MSIRAVIFDLGGVLVRTEDPAPRARLAARLGMSPAELSQIIFDNETARQATVGAITTQEHWEAVRWKLHLSPEEFPVVPVEFWGGDTLDRDLVDYIRALRPRYKTALLSNAWDDLRQVLEEYWKIADAFDEIFISAEAGLAKPDPRLYRLALARLQVDPPEAVFVDDFPENVAGALAVGMQAIQFRSPEQALAELAQVLDQRRRTEDG
jgi:epoxide hydrolase-like predicted phosphatase